MEKINSNKKDNIQKCPKCGKIMIYAIHDRHYPDKHGCIFVMTNIPAWECRNCNERMYTKEISDMISSAMKI